MSAPPSPPVLTVYYDGACPVCSREIALYRRQPGAEACAWVDASAADPALLGPDLAPGQALARLHVRQADGSLVAGARGFALLWQALPRLRWLGRLASVPPLPWVLDAGYALFLAARPLWRPKGTPATEAITPALEAELRSDHAGETGAVQIYRGILAVSGNPAVRTFAEHHLATEQSHLDRIEQWLPPGRRSRLLPAWRVAGWVTGALPALFGPAAVYGTIAAVETFVDRHYQAQLDMIDALPPDAVRGELRALLEECQADEVGHRDEARSLGPAGRPGPLLAAWAAVVGSGSAFAVRLARRF